MFKQLRVLFLLLVLLLVAVDTWLSKQRSTDWDSALRVVIYPINADGSAQSKEYIETLTENNFQAIEKFMADEAVEFGLVLKQPVEFYLSEEMLQVPPAPPEDRQSMPAVVWWSLQMRYFAFFKHNYLGPKPHVKIFVLYHDPDLNPRLPHSLGLEKGLIGVVNVYAQADYAGRNQVVISHEMLHTLGATDKYDMQSGRPLHPKGYAEPNRIPLHPQEFAEIMAGQISLTETNYIMPDDLDEVMIGPTTAFEINWLKSANHED